MNSSIQFLIEEIAKLKERVDELETQDSLPVVAICEMSSNQTISSGSQQVLNFADTIEDTRSAVTQSPNTKFTAPVAGYYSISVYGVLAGTSASWGSGETVYMVIYVNSSSVRSVGLTYGNTFGMNSEGTVVIHLDKDDVVEIYGFQDSGVNQTFYGSSGDIFTGRLCIHRIRGY